MVLCASEVEIGKQSLFCVTCERVRRRSYHWERNDGMHLSRSKFIVSRCVWNSNNDLCAKNIERNDNGDFLYVATMNDYEREHL